MIVDRLEYQIATTGGPQAEQAAARASAAMEKAKQAVNGVHPGMGKVADKSNEAAGGLNALSNQLSAVIPGFGSLTSMTGTASAGLAGFAAAAIAAGVAGFQLGRRVADEVEQLDNMAISLSTTTERLVLLQRVGKEAGIPLESMTGALLRFSMALGKTRGDAEANAEEIGKMTKAFKLLGITAQDPLDALGEFKNVLDKIDDRQKAQTLAFQVLGMRGRSAMPLMLNRDLDFDELTSQIKSSGAVIDEQLIARARELDHRLDVLGRSWEAAGNAAKAAGVEFALAMTSGFPTGELPTGRTLLRGPMTAAEAARNKLDLGGFRVVGIKDPVDEALKVLFGNKANDDAKKKAEQLKAAIQAVSDEMERLTYRMWQANGMTVDVFKFRKAPRGLTGGIPGISEWESDLFEPKGGQTLDQFLRGKPADQMSRPDALASLTWNPMRDPAWSAAQQRQLEAARLIHEGATMFRNEARDMGTHLFDALYTRGRTGLLDLAKTFFVAPLRTIFGNVFGEIFSSLRGVFGGMIGGQVQRDANGQVVLEDDPSRPGQKRAKMTRLGRILQGTVFGVDQNAIAAKALMAATTVNTASTDANTAAILANTAALQAVAVTSGIGGIPGAPGGGGSPFLFNAFGSNGLGGLLAGGIGPAIMAVGSAVGGGKGKAIIIGGGTAFGGVMGAKLGASGALGGPAGALVGAGLVGGSTALAMEGGMAQHVAGGAAAGASIGFLVGSLFPGVGNLLGAGIGAAIGAGVGVVRTMFKSGPSPEQRAAQIEQALSGTAFTYATPLERAFGYNSSGFGQTDIGYGWQPRISVNVQTMDAKSFMDNAPKITDAVYAEMRRGMHPMNNMLRGAIG